MASNALNMAMVMAPMKSDIITIAVTIVNIKKNKIVVTYRYELVRRCIHELELKVMTNLLAWPWKLSFCLGKGGCEVVRL